MDLPAILIRFGTYGALSLIAGVPLFLLLSLGPERGAQAFARWRGAYALMLAAGIALGLLGLLAATAGMTGAPLFPVDWEMVSIVLSATTSAQAILWRVGLLVLMLAIAMLPRAFRLRFPALCFLSLGAAATLGWSGHAAAGEGATGWLHLGGDIAHILAAALWIGGMACLIAALRHPANQQSSAMLSAFSWIGAGVVGVLLATGILNLVLTVGLDAVSASLHAPYGKLLIIKILLFCVMLGLAANNRFRLTPAFDTHAPGASFRLRRSIGVEIGLAFLIMALVATLGMIDPLGME